METWRADGWDILLSGIRGWEYRDGTDQVASSVGANGAVPNRTGELWRPKSIGPGMFTLGLWLAGTTRAEVEAQFALVLRACVRPHRLVRMERVMADGSTRWADVEYAGQIRPTYISQRGMRASIDFKVPDGVWRGAAAVNTATAAGAALPQTLSLAGVAESTAAIEDSTFNIYGPITTPLVVDRTDGVDGDVFKYDTVIGAGQWLNVSCKTWQVSGGGGHVVNLAKVFPGGRRMLTIPPARPGSTPTLELRGSGGGAGTRLSFTGYPTFAC